MFFVSSWQQMNVAMNKSSKPATLEEIRTNRTEIIGTIAMQYLQSLKVKSATR
jgi:hypothetical protein